jgi:flagellin
LSSDFAFGTDQNQVVESFKAIQNLIGGFNPDGSVNEEMQNKGLWIQSGADAGNGMYISVDTMNLSALGINGVDVSTEAGASNAIDLIGTAVDKISSMRSSFGAQQNRLEHTYKNVTNTAENTQAAESRIRDTDMAKEMVELSKHNILEQVGTSMIAQANQSNQGVLNLLQ